MNDSNYGNKPLCFTCTLLFSTTRFVISHSGILQGSAGRITCTLNYFTQQYGQRSDTKVVSKYVIINIRNSRSQFFFFTLEGPTLKPFNQTSTKEGVMSRPRPSGRCGGGDRVVSSLIRKVCSSYEWSTSRPGGFTFGQRQRYPLNRRLGRSQSPSTWFGEAKDLLPLPRVKPWTVQPITLSWLRRCTTLFLTLLVSTSSIFVIF